MSSIEVTKQDIVNHREYVDALLSKYSPYIDSYKFDAFRDKIYNPYRKQDGDDEEWLTKTLIELAPDIKFNQFTSPGLIASEYLTQTICQLEGVGDLINSTLNNNKDAFKPFDLFRFIINDKLIITSDEIPARFFDGTEFSDGDVYVKSNKIHEKAFKNVYMGQRIVNGFYTMRGSLHIDEGCEEIAKSALEVSYARDIFLPKSLKRLEPQVFNDSVVGGWVYYNGTSSKYIELLKNSGWKKIPKAHKPIMCTDKLIYGGLDLQ